MRRREHQSGFGTIEILLVVLVVAVLAVVGVVVSQHHKPISAIFSASTSQKQTTTQPKNTTTTQPAQTTTSATYTSTAGGFSFTYPSGWKVTESPVGSNDEIVISPVTANTVTNGKATPNLFSMAFNITNTPASPFSSARMPKGTIQTSSNGIPIWTATEAGSTIPTNPAGLTVCPELLITSADKTNFNFALPNSKYLILEAGYCQGQGANTSLTYQQQLASQDWQSAIAIIQSIKFQ